MSNRPSWLLCAAALVGSSCGGGDQPSELADLIHAVDRVGLIPSEAFVDTVLDIDRDSPKFRARLDSGFLALPTGAAQVILASDRVLVAVDSSTSFFVSVYSRDGHLQLVHVFAPVVNGTERQNEQMLATIHAVASVLAHDTTGLVSWVDSSWQAVWTDWEHSRAREDRVKERRFGHYLMAVSGVPPDLVFFGALRAQQ
jgi:hypothetical protein